MSIRYRSGYKYQLAEDYHLGIPVYPDHDVKTEFIELNAEGYLRIKNGYAWDGPSGPTIDTKTFMRGALVHDALYQLMRNDELPKARWREIADDLLKQYCLEDGMWSWRAALVHRAVRLAGDIPADPASRKEIMEAP